MINKSIWEKYFDNVEFPSLDKDIEVDIAIIGGGITGITIGYFLRNSNLKVAIFERDKIGHGITSRTTAKITTLQQGILTKIKNTYDKDTSKEYFESQKYAIKLLTDIINENNIDCDLENVYSYYFGIKEKDVKRIKEEERLLKSFNEEVRVVNNLPDGLKFPYGISIPNTYVFNPIKYLNSLKDLIKNKVLIYENSKVIKYEYANNLFTLYVNGFKVKAKKLIIASHYPYFLFPYLMPLKCSLEKSYIGCYKTTEKNNFSAISDKNPTLSIRYIKDKNLQYKLILTNSHNTATHLSEFDNFKILSDKSPDYLWSNIDIITKDHIPYIGEIANNQYIATGYNTWGMTNSVLAGKIISDAILNKENKYLKLFNPKRHNNLNTIIKYPLYGLLNSYAFINSKLSKNKNVELKKINGINVGIYKDINGTKHIVKTTCPHLGCGLIFNEVELTWDCPCHASRFNIDGHVITGPSKYDISFRE